MQFEVLVGLGRGCASPPTWVNGLWQSRGPLIPFVNDRLSFLAACAEAGELSQRAPLTVPPSEVFDFDWTITLQFFGVRSEVDMGRKVTLLTVSPDPPRLGRDHPRYTLDRMKPSRSGGWSGYDRLHVGTYDEVLAAAWEQVECAFSDFERASDKRRRS